MNTEMQPARLPALPWRDPHGVSPAVLGDYVRVLERACREDPESPDLHTCLGMAYAMNYQVYESMGALEKAVRLDPEHFFAQYKYSELFYRLRLLPRAEEETIRALELANNRWQMALARKQLQDIRRLTREGTQRPAWTRPLARPAVVCLAMLLLLCLAVAWK